jgi:hypothetical protein
MRQAIRHDFFKKHLPDSMLAMCFILLVLAGNATHARGGSPMMSCEQDNGLQLNIEFIKTNHDDNISQAFAYAEAANYLLSRVEENTPYCGFSGRNIVFLARQAASDITFEKPKSSRKTIFDFFRPKPIESNERWLAGMVAPVMSKLFGKGKFGLPQDQELADCWKRVLGRFSRCEAIELAKYGRVDFGTAVPGVKILREFPTKQ